MNNSLEVKIKVNECIKNKSDLEPVETVQNVRVEGANS